MDNDATNDAPIGYGELRDGTWYRIPDEMVQSFSAVGLVVKRSPDGSHYVKYECALAVSPPTLPGDQK